jgi:hypothetical protein
MKLLTETTFSIFSSLSFLLLISTLYPAILEIAREICQFYCQENLTKLFSIFFLIGTAFANSS